MPPRQPSHQLASSSSACLPVSLTSLAYRQRSQARRFQNRRRSSDWWPSPSAASCLLAAAWSRFCASTACFSPSATAPPACLRPMPHSRSRALPPQQVAQQQPRCAIRGMLERIHITFERMIQSSQCRCRTLHSSQATFSVCAGRRLKVFFTASDLYGLSALNLALHSCSSQY